jgi:hypothetical protein
MVIVFLGFVSLGANVVFQKGFDTALAGFFADGPASLFFLMPFRIYEFAIGALLAFVPLQHNILPRWLADILSLAGLAAISASFWFYHAELVFPLWYGLLPCVGGALIIATPSALFNRLVLSCRPVVAIGLISYSLYLVHWPLIVFFKYYTLHPLSLKTQLVLIIASFGLALLLYYGVEQPFRKQKVQAFWARFLPKTYSFPASAMALVILIAGLFAHALTSEGWAFRLDEASQERLATGAVYGGQGCEPPRCETAPGQSLRKAYILGDSHGRQYYAALKELFPDTNFVVFESSSCTFFSKAYHRQVSPLHTRLCLKAKAMAYQEVFADPAPVFLVQYWNTGLFQPDQAGQGSPDARHSLDIKGLKELADFASQEITALKKQLNLSQIVVIGNVPALDHAVSPLDCISRPIAPRHINCAQTLQSDAVISFNAALNKELADVFETKKPQGLSFLNPFDALCEAEICHKMDQKSVYYSDQTHLTPAGARQVLTAFSPAIRSVLDNPSLGSRFVGHSE